MGNDMVDKITPYDAEKIARSLIMELHGVSSKCIDWKLKTSRKTRHKQDLFGVFDAIINDNDHITIGYQFKYWGRDITNNELLEWSEEVSKTNFDPRNAFLMVLNHKNSKVSFHNAADCLTKNKKVRI